MYEGIYKRGVAVGDSNIITDTMTFRFKNEVFEFPSMEVFHLARYNGYWYEARVRDLRKLKSKLKRRITKRRNKNGIRRAI